MPKQGPDKKKLNRILIVLNKYPKGIWIRELARQSKLPVSTLHFYLNKYLIEEVSIENLQFSNLKINQKIVKLNQRFEITPELAEICGIHAGDGYLRNDGKRREIDISGNLEEKEYYDLHVSKLFEKEFKIKPKCKFFPSRNTYGFIIRNKILIKLFHNLGFPYGKKSTIVEIPSNILTCKNKNIISKFIRGVFDTDGSLTFDRKNKNKYHKYPRIIFGTVSKKFHEQLLEMLDYIGFRTYVSTYNSKNLNENKAYKIWITGISMLNKWIEEIGSKNSSKFSRYLVWKKYGFCPPNTTFEQRRNILKGKINPKRLYNGSIA